MSAVIIQFPKAKRPRPISAEENAHAFAMARAAGDALISCASDLATKPSDLMRSTIVIADLFTGDD